MVNNRLYIALTCALLAFACIGLMITSSATPAYVPAEAPAEQGWQNLTQDQKNELLTIFEEKTQAERKFIEKAAEYGVMPQEKAQKILEKLTERLEKVKSEGFLPKKEAR